jgi:hypothetical protein
MRRRAARVPGEDLAAEENIVDGLLQAAGLLVEAHVSQEHHTGEEHACAREARGAKVNRSVMLGMHALGPQRSARVGGGGGGGGGR